MKRRANEPEKTARPSPSAVTRGMSGRFIAVGAGLMLFFCVLVYMLYTYQIRDTQEWRARAEEQQTGDETIAPNRGNIYDANMKLLATSATVWTVTASPDAIHEAGTDVAVLAAKLAELLEMDAAEVQEKLTATYEDGTYRTYQLIKRQIEKPVADELESWIEEYNADPAHKNSKVRGITLEQDSKRYYPYNNLASTVIGYVNVDGDGVNGLERYYNEDLKGTPGRVVVPQNAWGDELPETEYETQYDAIDGSSLVLTIDQTVQSILEKQVQTMVELNNVKERAVGIVMDVKTGAILAMTTKPDYDLNDPNTIVDAEALAEISAIADEQQRQDAYDTELWAQRRNKAVSDLYYPGSVFKIITASAALDSGKATVNTHFTCTGSIEVPGWSKPIACAGQHVQKGLTNLSFYDGLNYSCNPYFVQLGWQMGAETFADYLNVFGFNERTGIDMDDEAVSQTYSADELNTVQLASSAFGQSSAVTPIAMLTAASAAINGGQLVVPYVVDKVLDADGNVVEEHGITVKRQVISEETSRTIAAMLEESVATGHGNNAYVAGYRIGGKSGTSQKDQSAAGDDETQTYVASFFGFAPADDPQVAVLILADTPSREDGNTFGGRICGPYVGKVMREILPYLGVERSYDEGEAEFAEITLPDVTGELLDEAMIQLNKAGSFNAETFGAGTSVVAQYPAAGTKLAQGSTIMLYTDESVAAQTVTVPNLVGMTYEQVEQALAAEQLNLLPIGAAKDSATVKATAQNVAAGESVQMGAVIEVEFQDESLID
ncbi:MAG TPA: PASTA domain-containing protein [Candidatus Ruthenibacterium merdigallinarum]|nr:PASTA domain-containing protein [Candidatus Ruthenibacterium merdigallinarum]